MDITEKKKAEEDIRRYISQVIRTHEDERTSVAQELHDEIIQGLADLIMRSERLIKQKDPTTLTISKELLNFQEKLVSMVNNTRRLCGNLRHDALDQIGLITAIEVLASELRNNSGLMLEVVPILRTEKGLC